MAASQLQSYGSWHSDAHHAFTNENNTRTEPTVIHSLKQRNKPICCPGTKSRLRCLGYPACCPLQAQLPYLGLPQSSRALVSSVALGYSPPAPWISSYMQRFKASLSELNPEGLVDVLRALSSADALPSHQWLTDYEQDLERR